MKKSKQFEIQKLVRRLKKASTETSSKDAANISKLESVLTSLRAADIDRLANLAAASVGYNPDGTAVEVDAAAVDDVELLDRKILSANCVTDQLGVMIKALKAIKTKAERQNGKQKESAPAAEEAEKINTRRKAVGSGSDDVDEENASEEESEIEPDEDALQAIEKLLALKQKSGQRGGAGDGGDRGNSDEGSSDDDSGVIENVSEQEEDMLVDTEFNSNTEDEEDQLNKGDYKNNKNGGGGSGEVKKKVKAKPKKSKNRLGQRARRQLAGYQPPQMHGGVRKREDACDGGGRERERREDSNRKKEEVDEGPLHPSWAARRQEKQKLSIVNTAAPSSNKKIVFNEDGGKKIIAPPSKPSAPSNPRHQLRSTGPPASKYQNKGNQEESEGPLHPSWELKKKLAKAQKQLLKNPSQGTKIVFDD